MEPELLLELAQKCGATIDREWSSQSITHFKRKELLAFANECQALVLDAWGKQAPVAWFNRNTGEFIKDEGDVGFLNFIPLYAAPKPAEVPEQEMLLRDILSWMPELGQLTNKLEEEWKQQGCWSEWDESVQSRRRELHERLYQMFAPKKE